MFATKKLFLLIFFLCAFQSLDARSLAEQFKQQGFLEICDTKHGITAFTYLYQCFDALIETLQKNPGLVQKLYSAKERFIRSKERSYYSTDFFGFYDESKEKARGQIAFYYAAHFHEFLYSRYPEFKQIPEMNNFFEICYSIQKEYVNLFQKAAIDLGVEIIFSSPYGHPPILFKVVKYFPSYVATRPHYDGTVFSLFLDSTDNQSLSLASYKPNFIVDDFYSPIRAFSRCDNQNSILLIPGALLTEFSIYPTPHIVMQHGKIRYATIAFAMRPNYISQRNDLSSLPNFNH